MSRATTASAPFKRIQGPPGPWTVNTWNITSPGREFLVGDILTAKTEPHTNYASWIVTAIDSAGRITGLELSSPGDYSTRPPQRQQLWTSVPRNQPCRMVITWQKIP